MNTRAGSVYVVVLLSSLIVATMALSSIETMRYYSRDLSDDSDATRVQLAAEAGLEAALAKICDDPDWRSNHSNNVDSALLTLDGVSLRYRLIDEDGDLDDDEYDEADLIVTATRGSIRHAWQATLNPNGSPIDCLLYSISSKKKFSVPNVALVATNQSVGCNDKIEVDGHLTADCFAKDSITGNIYGSQTTVSSVDFPDKKIVDYYIDNSTAIELSDLTESGGRYYISNALLSANANTLNGVLDPEGMYTIDCQGNEVYIENSRLRCTLTLKNPDKKSRVRESVYWEAHHYNYPILIVDGEFELAMRRTPLRESDVGINLNPPGTPHQGLSDGNTNTIYPSQLRGLIFTTKDLHISDGFAEVNVVGTVVSREEFNANGDIFVEYRDIFALNPPPGFGNSDRMQIMSGSVRRVAVP